MFKMLLCINMWYNVADVCSEPFQKWLESLSWSQAKTSSGQQPKQQLLGFVCFVFCFSEIRAYVAQAWFELP